ncbi:MAG TPA: hypothetical protein VGN69_08760 [Solirubrobacteraceae bacterium]|jgi:protein ImuB|nr:hypothetical protein [Solirubrobacteraceae bacterium]
MIVCVWLPRFELAVAAGGPHALAAGPLALAPQPGREQRVGEVSAAAETFGVRRGMALGEALTRCPSLALIPADPVRVGAAWESLLGALESIGAEVESEQPGLAYFEATGLRGLHGGDEHGVMARARHALARPARLGGGPTRFCALAAARTARSRRPTVVADDRTAARRHLAPQPVSLLKERALTASIVPALERLGIRTLGELAALPRDAVADRFGSAGMLARRLALGQDEPLRPRQPGERLAETLELPEAVSGPQLERALGMLLDRLLARRERRGRMLRTIVIAARLVEGGTWHERVVFREALGDPERMRLALTPRLGLLPAPADALRLVVERFGPAPGDQRALLDEAESIRRARLREAVHQTRALAGPEAALRVLYVDELSRVPERRAMLAPFEV